MHPRLRRTVAGGAVVVLAAALTGCTGGGHTPDAGVETQATSTTIPPDSVATDLPAPPQPSTVVVGEAAVATVSVYDTPLQAGPAPRTVSSPLAYGGSAIFLVDQGAAPVTPGWLKVELPVRPTGSTGWVHESDLRLSQHEWRIVVETDAHRLTVYRGQVTYRVESVGVGRTDRTTPQGRYFTSELVKPRTQGTTYGAFAYGLTAWTSPTDTPENPYDGQLGIHGTNDPATLGHDVSDGSIRMSDDAITALANVLPLGVPVIVQP